MINNPRLCTLLTIIAALGAAQAACSSAPPEENTAQMPTKIDSICGDAPAASLDGIPAYPYCGNTDVWTNNGVDTLSYSGGPGWVQTEGGYGYQCVEFAVRYFWFKWGVSQNWHVSGAADMCSTHPADVSLTSNPVHGDLAVFTRGACGSDPTFGHVAAIKSVGAGTIDVVQENVAGEYTFSQSCVQCYLHASANTGSAPPPSGGGSPPPLGAPGGFTAESYRSLVALTWNAVSGATSYTVSRPGHTWTTAGTSFVDHTVSPGQSYTYSVAAANGGGSSAVTFARASTAGNAADRAFVRLNTGLAECGLAGGYPNNQSLVCNVLSSGTWNRYYYPTGDWGYSDSRAWVDNIDGSISYCRTVGTGNQIKCDTFDGTSWRSATTGVVDVGYARDRAYLPTPIGPAECGRAGGWPDNQSLVCNVLNLSTNTWSMVYSGAGDWGYESDRAWVANKNGTVSYCGTVGTGNQWMCRTFDGTRFTAPSVSGVTDVGYGDGQREVLPTTFGPAACGRAGGYPNNQSLVCNLLDLSTNTWKRTYSYSGDWGYQADRAWVANDDGSVSYCGMVGTGNQVRCDTFDGTSFRVLVTDPTDVGYGDENRVFIATKAGPAECARAGDHPYNQSLTCVVFNLATGTWSQSYSYAGDWFYAPERTWIETADGNVSYCGLVGTGNQVRCDTFDGTSFSPAVSGVTDVGYPQGH